MGWRDADMDASIVAPGAAGDGVHNIAGPPATGAGYVQRQIQALSSQYQHQLDRSTPHSTPRWACFFVLSLLFALRIVLAHGWYIVAYAWAIYLLNNLILFL